MDMKMIGEIFEGLLLFGLLGILIILGLCL